jgi:hypothetical protein
MALMASDCRVSHTYLARISRVPRRRALIWDGNHQLEERPDRVQHHAVDPTVQRKSATRAGGALPAGRADARRASAATNSRAGVQTRVRTVLMWCRRPGHSALFLPTVIRAPTLTWAEARLPLGAVSASSSRAFVRCSRIIIQGAKGAHRTRAARSACALALWRALDRLSPRPKAQYRPQCMCR